jgi:hypothetical protein
MWSKSAQIIILFSKWRLSHRYNSVKLCNYNAQRENRVKLLAPDHLETGKFVIFQKLVQ